MEAYSFYIHLTNQAFFYSVTIYTVQYDVLIGININLL